MKSSLARRAPLRKAQTAQKASNLSCSENGPRRPLPGPARPRRASRNRHHHRPGGGRQMPLLQVVNLYQTSAGAAGTIINDTCSKPTACRLPLPTPAPACWIQWRTGDDRFHLHARPPAWCDGPKGGKLRSWHGTFPGRPHS
jgi:hypothetical protein